MTSRRPQARSLRLVREIEDALGTLKVDGPPLLPTLLGPLQELLQLDKVLAYGVEGRPEGAEITFGHALGGRLSSEQFAREFRQVVRGAPRWGFFDPRRPERQQRNRVVAMPPTRSYDEVLARAARSQYGIHTTPALDAVRAGVGPTAKFMNRMGVDADHQLRILVCDDSGVLAWVGGYRAERVGPREQRLLQRLSRPLQRHLALERKLQHAPLALAALDATLDALARPAFVVGADGRILLANVLGRGVLARDGVALRRALLDAAQGRASAIWSATPLVLDSPRAFLILGNAQPDPSSVLPVACRRWGLTPRQGQVLRELCTGATNKEIGMRLGAAERTVEVHMTALMEKAGVESRAALVAAFWRQA